MQQIKRKNKKTNLESKLSKTKTTISLSQRIIKCNTKKIYLTIDVFCIAKCSLIIGTLNQIKRKKKQKMESKKAKQRQFKQMKIIAVYTQLKQLRNKAWKKFRPERESNPWPLRYRCSALTNWAIKPTGSWSIVSSLYTRRWRRCDKNTWKSYIYML